MSVAELKRICDERNIHKVAMVDDVFDVPESQRLDRHRYSEFRRRYNANQGLKNAVAWVSGIDLKSLPGFDDLRDEELEPLWKCVWKTRTGGRRLSADHTNALRALFVGHGHDVLGMLDDVIALFTLFRSDLGRVVTVHGTDYSAGEVAKSQIVVLDYFLGHNLTVKEAQDRASGVVVEVVKVARSANRSVPSFLLVSSRPKQIDIEAFRKRSELMKSRFRFFAKDALNADRIESMVNVHDLVDASDRTERIEQLIENWQEGATRAISLVRERMLTLDVSDFVYLDCFRLTHEGTSIGNYLRWFMTASLSAKITDGLDRNLWREADALKLFNLVDESGSPDPTTLIKTFDGPSRAIADAYGDILFDETRGTGDCVFPAPVSGRDLVEGDLFVRPKGRDRKGYEGAEVRLVMTPSCDLRTRTLSSSPVARSVLLLPGTLKGVVQEDKEDNFSKVDFVRVRERGEWRLLRIVWEFRHPISIEWSEISDEGPGKAFRRLGRVRDLFFHRVRDEFVNIFTRIGTETPPLFPHSRNGEVFIAVQQPGKRRFERVMCFSSEDGFVWEIGPVRVANQTGRFDDRYIYQASREFVGKLVSALGELQMDPEFAPAAERSAQQLSDMQNYMSFLKPMLPGVRGEGRVVEFKKAVKRENANVTSRANLLVVTFID